MKNPSPLKLLLEKAKRENCEAVLQQCWSITKSVWFKHSYSGGSMKWKGREKRTFLSFLKFSIRKTQGQEVGSFFNSFEMIRWRQPERTFNYMMRGRKGGRERKGPGGTCFCMLNDEEENGNLKGKMAFKQITWEWNTKSTRGKCGHFMLETKAAATWSSPQPPPPPHLPPPAAVMGDALWCRVR